MSSYPTRHLSRLTDLDPAPPTGPGYAPAYGMAPDYAAAPGSTGLPWTDPSVTGDPSWRLDALCAETDPEAFFPEKGGSTRDAKRVCSGCPVRAECLEFALANDERFGIWGGLSERERRRLRLQQRMELTA